MQYLCLHKICSEQTSPPSETKKTRDCKSIDDKTNGRKKLKEVVTIDNITHNQREMDDY